ncbi:hypothetical protein F511_22241 [Dorcoceras hygrometricum]|uniref:Uncharacterized protein n=1 Tax=Dorcoceras hygrometricum TaxID=472368 RepID=A0A2Z7C829_9LAMI|nr:hypothetical protein F511_22241 [Dorcoceras hygrometricum]
MQFKCTRVSASWMTRVSRPKNNLDLCIECEQRGAPVGSADSWIVGRHHFEKPNLRNPYCSPWSISSDCRWYTTPIGARLVALSSPYKDASITTSFGDFGDLEEEREEATACYLFTFRSIGSSAQEVLSSFRSELFGTVVVVIVAQKLSVCYRVVIACLCSVLVHTAAQPQSGGGSSRGRSFPVQQQRLGEPQFRPFQQPGPSRFG